jgi:hypothetical protein
MIDIEIEYWRFYRSIVWHSSLNDRGKSVKSVQSCGLLEWRDFNRLMKEYEWRILSQYNQLQCSECPLQSALQSCSFAVQIVVDILNTAASKVRRHRTNLCCSTLLAEELGLPHIRTNALLNEEIKNNTPEGKSCKAWRDEFKVRCCHLFQSNWHSVSQRIRKELYKKFIFIHRQKYSFQLLTNGMPTQVGFWKEDQKR